ncbi:MAG: CBS domain-containing protein [Sedimenticola sp.]
MTAKSIMSFRLVKLKPTDKVCDALKMMYAQHIRNLPVVDENDQFVGLFGIRRLTRLLLPKAAQMNFGLQDLSFMPDETGEMSERLKEVSQRPVSDFLEKKRHLMFCKPSTSLPEVLELLDQSPDTSLPVIVLKGKKKKLVGMVSAWDVVEKMLVNMCEAEATATRGDEVREQGENEEVKES